MTLRTNRPTRPTPFLPHDGGRKGHEQGGGEEEESKSLALLALALPTIYGTLGPLQFEVEFSGQSTLATDRIHGYNDGATSPHLPAGSLLVVPVEVQSTLFEPRPLP